MTERQLLSGRAAVVVGGGNGIGAAVAEVLSRHGAGVVVNSRSAEAVERTVGQITELGGAATSPPPAPKPQTAPRPPSPIP
ncbi:SDR family NAD(P)-dependent oxidoreductase [Nocardia sp. NBC_01388]|uniref:SDR family NAD(P)-dependent oxidoreductase n=1 Tax=Nocardia sp. NBC_01388 TaxID=2903596 RepID=UPI003252B55D